jgi:hypothetical protein
LTEVWVVPELGTDFTENFSVMLIDYIYSQWPYTSETGLLEGLNKPNEKEGQSNYIEFRAGDKDTFKTLQVLTKQGRTVVVKHEQSGFKRQAYTTQVWVKTLIKVQGIGDTTPLLRKLDQAVDRICGMYRQINQTSGDMRGIKDLIYEGNDRVYGPKDQWDKSDWETNHSVLMFYEKVHGEQ